jgi:hypothetical protein
VLRQRPVQLFFASVFFHVLSHIGIYVFFSLYLDALGYSKTMIGVFWALSVVVEIAWFMTQSRWLPRLSMPGWLMLCSALMALRMLMTAGAADHWWVLVLARQAPRTAKANPGPNQLHSWSSGGLANPNPRPAQGHQTIAYLLLMQVCQSIFTPYKQQTQS